MERRSRPGNRGERGFTLAAVLVLLTIIMVFVAYTVPKQWSAVLQRDRERQTMYAMQQYARACLEFQRKNQTYPVSVSQLKEARSPRMIRGFEGEIVDPLTGEVDWLVIPQSQAIPPGGQATPPNIQQGGGANPNNPNGPPALPGVPIKDYAGGPFVGVRPPVTGKAMVTLYGDSYETWNYTALNLQRDIQLKLVGLQTVWK